VSGAKAPREDRPNVGARPNKQDREKERQGLRQLIDQFRHQPRTDDEGGFYRNVGRMIIRPLMRPHWPADKRH